LGKDLKEIEEKPGLISYHPWCKLLRSYGIEINKLELEKLFLSFSNNGDYIKTSEFLISLLK
jgi:hypothetical protein